MEAKQTPLIELLERVPQNARCRVDEPDGMGSVFIPVGKLCHEAAAALAQQAEPVEPVSNEALRLAGLELIGLAEHDQHCDVFDLDDQGRHKACTCGLNDAIAVITQAGKSSPPQRKPLTIERLRDALVASRIIPPAAVEDPEEYDDGVTLHRIEALHRRIT